MVHVSNTCHNDEGQVMEDPAYHWIDAGVVDEVDVMLCELIVPTLPSDQIPEDQKTDDTQRSS